MQEARLLTSKELAKYLNVSWRHLANRRTKQIGDELIEHFEVIVVQPYKEFIIRGEKHEAGESYPSSELWGTYGFTCQDLDAAWLRFERIRAEREKRATAAVSLNEPEQTELSL